MSKDLKEAERLAALASYPDTNGPREKIFDDVTRMAAKLFHTPMAFISIAESDRLWFKSTYGLGLDSYPRGNTFCDHAIRSRQIFEVENATEHPHFKDHPFVVGPEHVRFYAGAPLIDSGGHCLGMLCLLDTQPRKLSIDERELLTLLASQILSQFALKKLDHEVRLRTHAIEQAPVAMLFVDRVAETRPILSANPAFCALTGYSMEEVRGLSIFALRGPDTSESEVLTIREALVHGNSYRTILKGYRKNGVSFWVDATLSPVIESDGACRYYYVVMDDVTNSKEREALIVDQQQNLIESQKMAALGRMAAGIAHEINNPLSIIRGRSEILVMETQAGRELTPARVQEAGQNIMRTVDRIVKIVRGLRGISRSSDQDPYVEASVADTLADAVELCRDRCLRKGIDLRLPKIPADSRMRCRPEQIVQVILNLVGNAIDQVEKGQLQGRLKESWIQLEFSANPNSLEIAVVDSGTGIDAKIRERVFEPFATTKDIGDGVGLGLFISKNIVEAHHGNLRIDTESPHTRFVILLPRDPDSLEKCAQAS